MCSTKFISHSMQMHTAGRVALLRMQTSERLCFIQKRHPKCYWAPEGPPWPINSQHFASTRPTVASSCLSDPKCSTRAHPLTGTVGGKTTGSREAARPSSRRSEPTCQYTRQYVQSSPSSAVSETGPPSSIVAGQSHRLKTQICSKNATS